MKNKDELKLFGIKRYDSYTEAVAGCSSQPKSKKLLKKLKQKQNRIDWWEHRDEDLRYYVTRNNVTIARFDWQGVRQLFKPKYIQKRIKEEEK